MNNSPNNNRNAGTSGDHTYNLDFEGNAAQRTRPPMTEEERRRIAAARAAGMRMNSSAGNPNGTGGQRPGSGQPRPNPNNPNYRPQNAPNGQSMQPRPNPNNPNYRPQNGSYGPNGQGMQPRPNPNYVNNPQQQRRPNPQQRPPDSFTGRKRRRKIQINAGAVIFVLLIGAVVGISAYQISKNPAVNVSDGSQAQYEEIIQNAQNSESIGEGTDSLGDTSSEVLTPETDAAEEEGGYKTVTVQNSTISEGDLVLVNFNYAYDRVDDVTLMNAYNERTGKIKVSSTTLGMIPEAFAALEELVAGLVADTGCDDLLLYSGHRTIADQQRIWDSNLASYGEDYTKTYVAVPGHSEHHTGLACDLGFYTDEGLSIPLVDHEYGTWVWAHCTEYGYILRYPADKAEITGIGHEQWHFRYVGLAHAYAVDTLGLCYEEYLDALKGYTADTKMLHISADRELTDVNAADLSAVSGGWLTYFIPVSDGETTDIPLPTGAKYADYEISGNNVDGFIVTITLD